MVSTATEGGVLGVLRAARPTLRSAHDRLAYAIHAAFLSVGYSLTATGSRAASVNPEGQENIEVEDAGWNEMEGAYAFQYSGAGQEGLCRAVLVKCIAVDDTLMVDVAPLDSEGNEEPLHLDIKVADYTTSSEGSNYGQLFKNLHQLVEKVNTQLLMKLGGGRIKSHTPVRGQSRLEDETIEEHTPRFGVGIAEEVPSFMPGLVYPPLPSIGGSDLLPGPGAGVYPSRVDPGVGGMLLGPNDPRWGGGGVGYGGRMGFDEGGSGIGIPPGARYDPIGPSGVPGFEPQRFARSRRPPGGGGIDPDLEQFRPF